MDELARRAIDVNEAQFALGNERFEEALGVFVRNVRVADIRDANHVSRVRAGTDAEIDALFGRCDEVFAHAPHRAFHCDNDTAPAFEARLLLEGYQVGQELVMVLEGELAGTPKEFDIRAVETESEWRAWEGLRMSNWIEHRAKLGEEESRDVGGRMTESRRRMCPPGQYYLGYIDGVARGNLMTLPGIGGMAQVEDMFVEEGYQHRGLATALIHRCVAECRRAGAGPVVIVADGADTPKEMYAAMGFRAAGVKRGWWR